MKFGVCVPNYGATASPDALCTVALEAEALGYDSVWTTDHILMPRNSGTPYERIFDSLVSLAYLAGQTRKVKLGISSLIIAMRDPLVAAKQLATIDLFSGGRLVLAIGAGWNQKEFSFIGSDFHTRGRRVNESIRLIRSLWRGDTTFESRRLHTNFQDAVFEPGPLSKDLKIWIGGASDAAMKRAARLGDAWHPNAYPIEVFKGLVAQFRELSARAREEAICVRLAFDPHGEKAEYTGTQGDRRVKLVGNMTENARLLEEMESIGISYAVIAPSVQGLTPVQEQLEGIRAFAGRFMK